MIIAYANYLVENNEVVIYTNTNKTHFPISSKVKIRQIPYKGKIGTIMWSILNKIETDIVIADIIILAVVLSIRNRNKVVYFAQDYDVSYYKDKIRQFLIKMVYFFGLKLLNIPCIAVSQTLKRELEIYKKDITVVPNGIDFKTFYPEPDEDLLKEKKNKKAVVIFSRKDPRKGTDIALKVLSHLSYHISKNELIVWVVGEKIKNDIFPYEVKNFGFVEENRLREILSSADVFLYPSRHEGMPLFVLESLACNCPVVTTKAVGELSKLPGVFICNDISSTRKFVVLLLSSLDKKRTKDFYDLFNNNKFDLKFNLDASKKSFEYNIKNIFYDSFK